MEVTNYKCDICGKVEAADNFGGPDGWATLGINTEDKEAFFRCSKDICPKCIVDNGLDDAMLSLKKGRRGSAGD